MTDPFDPLDELASAYLDGEATPEEVARLESDPTALERVDALRRVRAQLQARRADPIDPAERDRAIAVAVATADASGDATVTSLAEVAARRRRLTQRGRLVGIAAAVALVAALIPAVSRLGDDSGDPATASRDDDRTALAIEEDAGTTADQSRASSTTAPTAAGGEASTAMSAAALTDLGTVPDLPALAAAVRAALGPPPGPDGPAVAPPTPEREVCLAAAREVVATSGTTILLTAVAVLGARPVLATVTAEPDGTQVLTVVDPADGCALVVREVL